MQDRPVLSVVARQIGEFMRLSLCLPVIMLTACSHTITLFPRGGGEQATGTLNDGAKQMTVVLKGETYTGTYQKGTFTSHGFGQTYGARPKFTTTTFVGSNNQATALLTSGAHVLRCEFTITEAIGGNGVCVDKDETVYDMLTKVSQ